MAINLITVPLFEDEVLPSFLARIACANGSYSVNSFCADLGFKSKNLRDADTEDFIRFSAACSKSPDRLRDHALLRQDDGTISFKGRQYENTLLNRGARFCPLCLLDDDQRNQSLHGTRRYQRFHWMIGALQTCCEHGCEIVGFNSAELEYRRFEFPSQIDLIEEDVRLKDLIRPREPGPVDQFIMHRVEDRRQHGEVLDRMSLGASIALCEYIGVQLRFGKHHPSAILNDEEIALAADHAYRYLLDGEPGFNAALEEIRGPRIGMNWLGGHDQYGRLRRAFMTGRLGESLAFINELLARHSETHRAGELNSFESEKLQEVIGRRKHAASTQAAIRKRVTAQSGSVAPADDLYTLLQTSVCEDDASEILRSNLKSFRAFVSLGLIAPIFSDCTVDERKHQAERYRLDDLSNFLARLQAGAPFATQQTVEMLELMPANYAARVVGISPEEVVSFIITGRLAGSRQLREGHIAQVTYVDIGNLIRLTSGLEGYTFAEVADYLFLRRASHLRKMVKSKILNPKIYGKKKIEIFDRDEVEEFKKNYVTIPELLELNDGGKDPTWSRLRKLGLRPEFKEHGLPVTIVNRQAAQYALMRQRLYPK